MTQQVFSRSQNDAQLDAPAYLYLEEQLTRLEAQGVDIYAPELWHSHALLAAADFFSGPDTRAFAVSGTAGMVVAGVLSMENPDQSAPIAFEIRHTDGAVLSFRLDFAPPAEKSDDAASKSKTVLRSNADEPRSWTSLSSVDQGSIENIVNLFAQKSGTRAGGYPSIIATGAILALAHALEYMNSNKCTFNYEGLGDEEARVDHVRISISIDTPKPRPRLKP